MTDPSITSPVSEIFTQLADVRRSIASVTDSLNQLQSTEGELRQELQERMQGSQTRTIEGAGLQATLSRRKSVNVTDAAALKTYLDENGLMPGYMTTPRYDEVKAKKDAVKHNWPGVEEVAIDVLSIKDAKS